MHCKKITFLLLFILSSCIFGYTPRIFYQDGTGDNIYTENASATLNLDNLVLGSLEGETSISATITLTDLVTLAATRPLYLTVNDDDELVLAPPAGSGSGDSFRIVDDDGDTFVTTQLNPDEDIIRMAVANTEIVTIATSSITLNATLTMPNLLTSTATREGYLYVDSNGEINKTETLDIKLTDRQTYYITQDGDALTDNTGEYEYNLSTATITTNGETIVYAEDDSSNTRTKFIALKDTDIVVFEKTTPLAANASAVIYINGTTRAGQGSGSAGSTYHSAGGFTFHLEAGEFFTMGSFQEPNIAVSHESLSSSDLRLSFIAFADAEGVVHQGDLGFYSYTGNGVTGAGSTGVYTLRVSTTITETGTDVMEYTADAVNGDYWTVKKKSLVTAIWNTNEVNAATASLGWTVNGDATTAIGTQSTSIVLSQTQPHGTYMPMGTAAFTKVLEVGDIIRAQWDTDYGATTKNRFSITAIPSARTIITPITQTAYLKDVKALGNTGGSLTSGTNTRILNTVSGDTSIVSLSANQFTLSPGKYKINFSAPGYGVDGHATYLYNVTTSTNIADGRNEYMAGATNSGSTSSGSTLVDITTTTVFELRHTVQTTRGDGGGALVNTAGRNYEIYSTVEIIKLLTK